MKKFLVNAVLIFLCFGVFGQYNKEMLPTDTITFETPNSDIFLDSTSGNLWQVSSPHKAFFNSAHHGSKAIVTDTGYYPPNDTSTFIYIGRANGTCLTCMEFWHKYDMDTVGDIGIIEASYDMGNSWHLVKDTMINTWGTWFWWNNDYHQSSNTSTSHKLTISGKSDGWILSSFCWNWFTMVKNDSIILNPDTLLIRFTFISDSISNNKDGWMIDDIVSSFGDLGTCSSIEEKYFKNSIKISPNPFTTTTQITLPQTNQHITLALYDIQGKLLLQQNYTDTDKILLQRNHLHNGLYFLKLTLDGKWVETGKIVVGD